MLMKHSVILLILMISSINFSNEKDNLILLHNQARRKIYLNQLEKNDTLDKRAQEWANHISERGYIGHSDLKFPGFQFCGENAASGQHTSKEVFTDWMSSMGHRKTILGPRYTHVGIGIARSKDDRLYWCVCFGGL